MLVHAQLLLYDAALRDSMRVYAISPLQKLSTMHRGLYTGETLDDEDESEGEDEVADDRHGLHCYDDLEQSKDKPAPIAPQK
jgi:hypothetical protein